MSKYTAISLFSGIGGIDLAFSRAGFDIVTQVEIEPFCREVLMKHAAAYWPNAEILEDIRYAGQHNLPANPDVIFGGFPCQDISIAGKRQGITTETRSGLWIEFARIIGEIRPRVVLLENVAAITTLGGVQVIGDLAALGYDAEWGIIPAAAVGAPHRRERWFCVAYPDGNGWKSPTRGRRDNYDIEWNDPTDRSRRNAVESGTGAYGQSVDDANCERESQPQGGERGFGGRTGYDGEDMGDAASTGLQRGECRFAPLAPTTGPDRGDDGQLPPQSVMGRAVDGLRGGMDGYKWPARPGDPQQEWEAPRATIERIKDRAKRLKALGNAVVPQVVYPIAIAIRDWLDAHDNG